MASNTTSNFEPLYTLRPMPPLFSFVSDAHLALIVPTLVHWLTSAFFEICERTGWLEQYRLHTTAEELSKNRVTRKECLRVTLQCQGLQTLMGLALGMLGEDEVTGNEEHHLAAVINSVHTGFAALPTVLGFTGVDFKTMAINLSGSGSYLPVVGQAEVKLPVIEVLVGKALYWYLIPAFQLVCALVVADASMYCLHRLVHTNQWLYKHVHSQHHRLYVPYSWGGSYNHPFDSLIVDALSYTIGCTVSGVSTRQSMILFAYSSFKNVLDHCGYLFPWNPIRIVTGTDSGFHDVHHQSWGLKASRSFAGTNFGAHLSVWDRMMGTYFADKEQIAKLRSRPRVPQGSQGDAKDHDSKTVTT